MCPLGAISLLGIALYLVDVREKKKGGCHRLLGGGNPFFNHPGIADRFSVGRTLLRLGVPSNHRSVSNYHCSGHCVFIMPKKKPGNRFFPWIFSAAGGLVSAMVPPFWPVLQSLPCLPTAHYLSRGLWVKHRLQMSVAMLTMSLGWSIGALVCGQMVNRFGQKPSTIFGCLCLVAGGGILLTYSADTSLTNCSIVLGIVGVGMGFVSMATLLVVQDSLDISNLGVATSSHQFARTLGGTIGVGISGSFVTMTLSNVMESLMKTELINLPPSLNIEIKQNVENIFRPEFQALLAPEVQKTMQEAVAQGVLTVFWITFFASLLCLLLSILIPVRSVPQSKVGSDTGR